MSWDLLNEGSRKFVYKNEQLKKIRIPSIESLAFTKIIAVVGRAPGPTSKATQDLRDFIDLSNNKDFRVTVFVDIVRAAKCQEYLREKLSALALPDAGLLLQQSLLYNLYEVFAPALPSAPARPSSAVEPLRDVIYSTTQSIEFYDLVAERYDARNTNVVYSTHQAIVAVVERELGQDGGTVVDLGCGTGRQIGSHFVHRQQVHWFAIDGSQSMLDQFVRNTSSGRMRVTPTKANLGAFELDMVPSAKVVLLSFVLTSLGDTKVVDAVANRMSGGAILVVADIHPSYTLASPLYDFELPEGKRVALEPVAVYPDKLIERLLAAGLQLLSHSTIKDRGGSDYAFVSVYRKSKSS